MQDENDSKRTFLNRRDWGSYLCALQDAAGYPKVCQAVKSGREWFAHGASEASSWLVGSNDLRGRFSAG
jgi:hypothetical protein